MGKIDDQFYSMLRSIFPGVTPTEQQTVEMRKAFFSGAAALFNLLTTREIEINEAHGELAVFAEFLDMCKKARPKRMEHMTEPELGYHMKHQLDFIKACSTDDVLGAMLIIFQEDGITQYGATCKLEGREDALRELADRLEKKTTVERSPEREDWNPTEMMDLLSLVTEKQVPLDVIMKWDQATCQRVVEWAGCVHLAASDNDVEVPETPPEVKDYL